jgi:hypothetical protein
MHISAKPTESVLALMKRCIKGSNELVGVFYTASGSPEARARLVSEHRVGVLAIVRGVSEVEGNVNFLLQGVDLVQLESEEKDGSALITTIPTKRLVKPSEVLQAYIDQLKPEMMR